MRFLHDFNKGFGANEAVNACADQLLSATSTLEPLDPELLNSLKVHLVQYHSEKYRSDEDKPDQSNKVNHETMRLYSAFIQHLLIMLFINASALPESREMIYKACQCLLSDPRCVLRESDRG